MRTEDLRRWNWQRIHVHGLLVYFLSSNVVELLPSAIPAGAERSCLASIFLSRRTQKTYICGFGFFIPRCDVRKHCLVTPCSLEVHSAGCRGIRYKFDMFLQAQAGIEKDLNLSRLPRAICLLSLNLCPSNFRAWQTRTSRTRYGYSRLRKRRLASQNLQQRRQR